ncbi:hypothetical protein EAH68_06105 [Corynebacterium hylobatis]|uniref:Uncharacterized protein n=1 Tax=Corynebacterium hylobatis TaxID=1859290 RepID=A0A430HZ74_9CORY|nr:hypothetical protein [Corynebacterium hylobatis]RSZ63808.1 hypothetical protein EAH68_06105 [Corynebacterium hylobatis]
MTTETFLSPESLARLSELTGQQLLAYGSDLELDDRVGAFGAWLQFGQGWVGIEFVEQVIDFPDGERVESVLTVHPLTGLDPGGDPYPLTGTIAAVVRIQDRVAQINKLEGTVDWEWWRDSGVRIVLDSGQELLLHCASPVVVEVRMQEGPAGTLQPGQPGRVYQEGERRRYEYANREVAVL